MRTDKIISIVFLLAVIFVGTPLLGAASTQSESYADRFFVGMAVSVLFFLYWVSVYLFLGYTNDARKWIAKKIRWLIP